MKSIICCFTILLFFSLLLSSNNIYAQNEQKPTLIGVQIERAIPSKVFEYEEAQKNANEFFKKYMPKMNVQTFSSFNDTYYYIMQLESLNDLTKFYQELYQAAMKSGTDDLQKAMKGFKDKILSLESEAYIYDQENSYAPKEPRIKPEEVGFQRWMIFEYYPYYDEEALAACKKEIKDFYVKNNIDGGYEWFNKVFGGNSNISVVSEGGKNSVEYYTYEKDWGEKYGETFKPLYLKFMNFVKDYKVVYVWVRKDLSIFSEKAK